jgi:hypothetical protein
MSGMLSVSHRRAQHSPRCAGGALVTLLVLTAAVRSQQSRDGIHCQTSWSTQGLKNGESYCFLKVFGYRHRIHQMDETHSCTEIQVIGEFICDFTTEHRFFCLSFPFCMTSYSPRFRSSTPYICGSGKVWYGGYPVPTPVFGVAGQAPSWEQ